MESTQDRGASSPVAPHPQGTIGDPGKDYLDFLDSFHGEVWASIRHKEQNIWNYLSFYAAAIALLIGVGPQFVDRRVITLVVLVLSYWGMAVILDTAWWFARNLIVVQNVQKQLLGDRLDTVLPIRYFQRPATKDALYTVHLWVLALLIAGGFLFYLLPLMRRDSLQNPADFAFLVVNGTVLTAGLYGIWRWQDRLRKNVFLFRRECPGIGIVSSSGKQVEDTSLNIPVDYEVVREQSRSTLSPLGPLGLAVSLALLQLLLLLNHPISPAIAFTIPLLLLTVILLFIFEQWQTARSLARIMDKDEAAGDITEDWPGEQNPVTPMLKRYDRIGHFISRMLAVSGICSAILSISAFLVLDHPTQIWQRLQNAPSPPLSTVAMRLDELTLQVQKLNSELESLHTQLNLSITQSATAERQALQASIDDFQRRLTTIESVLVSLEDRLQAINGMISTPSPSP